MILVTLSALVVYFWPRPEVPGSPNLVGRITDANGKPMSGVKVEVFGGMATRFKFDETKTDQNGWYAFEPVKGGATIFSEENGERKASLLVGMRLEHSSHVSSDGKSWWEQTIPYIKGKTHVKNFTLIPGGTVYGRVFDAESNPVANFDMKMDVASPSGTAYLRYVTTDESGNFKVTGLPAGICIINANDSDWANLSVIGKSTVVAGAETEVAIVLPVFLLRRSNSN